MISIIVPVYKVEKYLCECVDSILCQTYTELEIILVDDGSPDHCGAICDEYAKKDGRIKVIHKENGGLSSARNAGLDIARGAYIGFVDSDDYIHPQMFEILHYYARKDKSDIVCTYLTKKDARETRFEVEKACPQRQIVSSEMALKQFVQKYRALVRETAQTKLYDAKLFEELRFCEGIIYEDADLLPCILRSARQITMLRDLHLYCYRINDESIMHSRFSAKRFCDMTYKKRHVELFHEWGLEEQRDLLVFEYLTTIIRHNKRVRDTNREFLPQLRPFLREYKRFRRWISSNCNICMAHKLLLWVFPHNRYIAEKMLERLTK